MCLVWSAWRFFTARIEFEEAELHGFFGSEYLEYAANSYIGIPFIHTKLPLRTTSTTERSAGASAAVVAGPSAAAQLSDEGLATKEKPPGIVSSADERSGKDKER